MLAAGLTVAVGLLSVLVLLPEPVVVLPLSGSLVDLVLWVPVVAGWVPVEDLRALPVVWPDLVELLVVSVAVLLPARLDVLVEVPAFCLSCSAWEALLLVPEVPCWVIVEALSGFTLA